MRKRTPQRTIRRKHTIIFRENRCNKEMQQHSGQKNEELYFPLTPQRPSGWCKRWAPLLALCAPALAVSSQSLVDTGWLRVQVQPSGRRKSTEDSPPCLPRPVDAPVSSAHVHHVHDDGHITCSHLTSGEVGKGCPEGQQRPGYNSIPVESRRMALVNSPQRVPQTPKLSHCYDYEVGLGRFLFPFLCKYLDFSESFILLSQHQK